MALVIKDWKNFPNTSTPITAEALEELEARIAAAIATSGSVGPQGPIGPQGAAGVQGSAGPQGDQGVQGVAGPQGPIGPSGVAGATGAQGPLGPQGASGTGFNWRGNWSSAATYAVADVVFYLGSSYYAVLTSTNVIPNDALAQWDLIVITGPAGPQGPQGPAGVQGPTGAQGPIGTQGPTGPAGPIGLTGVSGPQGIVGPQGVVGPIGPIGPTGLKGDTGAGGTIVGNGFPATSVGNIGDFYWDDAAKLLYGPKFNLVGGIGAFPTAGVFDTTTRPDEQPLTGSWAGPIFAADVIPSLIGNVITNTGSLGSSAIWAPSAGTTNCEIYCTLGPGFVDGVSPIPNLWWRVTNPNSGLVSGYYVKLAFSDLFPHKVSAGAVSGLPDFAGVPLNSGDSIGVRMVGSVMTFMRKPSGGTTWVTVGTLTDASFTSGSIGISFNAGGSGAGGIKTIGGGAVVAGTSVPTWPTSPSIRSPATYIQSTLPVAPVGAEYVWFQTDGQGNLLDILSGVG